MADKPASRQQPRRVVKVWGGDFLDNWKTARDGIEQVPCGSATHHKDAWFIDCDHTPDPHEYTESARLLCDEMDAGDSAILEVISSVYFTAWSLHRRKGVEHVEQWPLALVVLAGLREAGYEVVKKDG